VIRVCFLIRQLNLGGAQRQLLELAKGLDRTKFEITILTFYDGGIYAAPAQQLEGVRYRSLHKRGRWDLFGFVRRLVRRLRQMPPQILHGYLGVSNLLCVLVKPLLRGVRIVWGMRASNMDWERYDWLENFVFGLQRFSSRWADLIIVNSQAGRDYLLRHDFPEHKMLVIPNGIDIEYFRPDDAARAQVRAEWKIGAEEKLIGMVARFDPMKDHATFLHAAAALLQTRDDVRFVVVGEGNLSYQNQLRAQFDVLLMTQKVRWVGARSDMPAVYNAMDIVTSSSAYGEGFSNVIGEAMACGVPCVATAAGDSAMIVGDAGIVIPPGNVEALREAWQKMLFSDSQLRRALGEKARARIVENFSSRVLVQKTAEALVQLT
jgi:glycosyltransferase involved in cell wall biosynthesis